jgi:hypothetical protein
MSDAKPDTQGNVAPKGLMMTDARPAADENFLAKLGLCSLMLAGTGAGFCAYEYLSPNVLFEPPLIVKVGKSDEFLWDNNLLTVCALGRPWNIQ